MADSQVSSRSESKIDYNRNSEAFENENLNSIKLNEMLDRCGDNFVWKGSITQLKRFVSEELKLSGSWKSPGGDIKQFTNEASDTILKWLGTNKKKLLVVKEVNSTLTDALCKLSVDEMAKKPVEKSSNADDDHVHATTTTNINEKCEKCDSKVTEISYLKEEITKMNNLIADMMKKQQEIECKTELDIMDLTRNNNKMADEIDMLKNVIERISNDNEKMRSVLDMQQNEWVTIEKKSSSNTNTIPTFTPRSYAAAVSNSFSTLQDHTSTESPDESNQVSLETSFDTNSSKHEKDANNKSINDKVDNDTPTKSSQRSRKDAAVSLVIGDSMTKHINNEKLSYAAKVKTVCKTYRGAKIKEVHQHLQKDCGENKLQSIILHVGTNNLVSDDARMAAEQMEELIVEAKDKAENVAVSSIIKRYDNKVQHSHILEFNHLVQELCKKHNITFIDNSNIDKTMLNRSNLHLNYNGDRALGKTFCFYLRSVRPDNASNNGHYFRQDRRQSSRPKDWATCLTYLAHVAKMIQQ